MDDPRAPVVEPQEQVLPVPSDLLDAAPGELRSPAGSTRSYTDPGQRMQQRARATGAFIGSAEAPFVEPGRVMQRILVIGPGGAGKTSLSTRLGEVLGLPVIHLDALYWHPGWRATPPAEWTRVVEEAAADAAWIMDGNYGGTLERRIARADTIVFLDLPRLTCVRRVLWRRVRYAGRSRPSLPPGCTERIPAEFLRWIWTYGERRRPQILALLAHVRREKTVVVLRTPRQVRAWVRRLEARNAAAD